MKFKPLHDKVLVRRTEEEEVSAGGIVLPEVLLKTAFSR